MALDIPVGFGEAAFGLTLAGDPEPMYVTLGWENTLGDTLADLQAGLAQLRANWLAAFIGTAANLSDAWTYIGARATVNGSDSGRIVIIDPVVTPGTATGVSNPPPNVAVLIRKNASVGGRPNRGRWYMPFVFPESVVDNVGNLTGPTISAIQGRVDAFLLQCSVDGTEPRILHDDSLALAPTPISTMIVQTKAATQRRRLRP